MDAALVVSVGFAVAGIVLALIFLPSRIGTASEKKEEGVSGERIST
jgi:uncharacterized protein with PQ loop repeat